MSIKTETSKKAFAAFASGDIATLTDTIAPDCVWHVSGRSQLAGDYVGHEQILGYFGKLVELTNGTFTATLNDIGETEAGLVTCVVTLAGQRDGATLNARMVEIGRANASGQLAECWWFAEDAYAVDTFLGMAPIVLPTQTKTPAKV